MLSLSNSIDCSSGRYLYLWKRSKRYQRKCFSSNQCCMEVEICSSIPGWFFCRFLPSWGFSGLVSRLGVGRTRVVTAASHSGHSLPATARGWPLCPDASGSCGRHCSLCVFLQPCQQQFCDVWDTQGYSFPLKLR